MIQKKQKQVTPVQHLSRVHPALAAPLAWQAALRLLYHQLNFAGLNSTSQGKKELFRMIVALSVKRRANSQFSLIFVESYQFTRQEMTFN
jgi:hypothetical protein